MRISLFAKRKYGFITGASRKELYKDKFQEQWKTCNAIVLSWIMNTVCADLLSSIVYATGAFAFWKYMKEWYD